MGKLIGGTFDPSTPFPSISASAVAGRLEPEVGHADASDLRSFTVEEHPLGETKTKKEKQWRVRSDAPVCIIGFCVVAHVKQTICVYVYVYEFGRRCEVGMCVGVGDLV